MSSYRFDLEKAIAAWRRPFEHNRAFSVEDVEELECNLRDRVAAAVERGMPEEEAFREALRRMGSSGTAEMEYRKVYWGKLRRRRQLAPELIWRLSMLKNYLKIAVRSLTKQKGYAFLNIVGLAIGLACFLLISLFIHFELSYDTFHKGADRIYRVAKEDPGNDYQGNDQYAVTPAPIVDALMDELPDVEYATQIEMNGILLRQNDTIIPETGIYATPHFFDVFSFEMLRGNARTALQEPGSIVLTESLAQKYFGEQDPVGQTLLGGQSGAETSYRVAGVVADPPPNSHFTFDFVLSMSSSSNYRQLRDSNDWDASNYLTYVRLRQESDVPSVQEKLADLGRRHLGPSGSSLEDAAEATMLFLQPLTDIHLHSNLNNEVDRDGSITYVYLFSAIALLILVVACINYTNLATARSVLRAKEVGVRKVMGAERRQLIAQFMSEAMILSVAALVLAIGLVYLLLPSMSALTTREISLQWIDQTSFWITVVAIGLGVGIVAGSYPAIVLSGFAPSILMRKARQGRGPVSLRNGLVVAQFAITTMLIVGTIGIYRQMHYVQTASTGLDRDQVVLIRSGGPGVMDQYEALKQAALRDPNISAVTASRQDPVEIGSYTGITSWEGSEEGQEMSAYQMAVQPEFVEFFRIGIVEGRDFSDETVTDVTGGVLINETMARQLGWETAVGKWLDLQGREMRVIGVMEDFHFRSFHETIAPLALHVGTDWPFARLLVKVRSDGMQAALGHLEETMATFAPANPFVYDFLDDAYRQMYQTETRLGRLFGYFTVVAVVLACLGLFGLAAFMTAQRTKEIGIRKVLGAEVSGLVALLSTDFLKLVGIAFIIGAPIAYFAMQRWLEAFAYRIELGPSVFILAGGAAFAIALLAVSYQSVRAALADPVKSLRYE